MSCMVGSRKSQILVNGWETALQIRMLGFWWMKSWTRAGRQHLCPKNQTVSWAATKEERSAGKADNCPPLLCPHDVHLHYTQVWDLQLMKDVELMKQVLRRATEMIRGLEHRSYIKWLKQVGFSLQKRRLQGHLTEAFQYPDEACKKRWSVFLLLFCFLNKELHIPVEQG